MQDMRGIVEHFDEMTGDVWIRAQDGATYSFSRARLLRHSKAPRPRAKVVFRLKQGKVRKAAVIAYERQWGWLACVVEALLHLPASLSQ